MIPWSDPNDPSIHWVMGEGPDYNSQKTMFELLGLKGNSLYVGAQGTGSIADNPLGTDEMLLWKVISIAGAPPDSWQSMDIYQDLPVPSANTGIA